MSQKVLDEILGSLSEKETTVTNESELNKEAGSGEGLIALEKEAGYSTPTITKTESGIKYPTTKKGPDSTTEKKLGLLGLTPGKHATEEMADPGVAGQPSTNAGTEGIKVPKMKKGCDSVLEKQASVMANMEELLGMDLQKTASISDEESLEKLAYSTLVTSVGELDKIAMDMADVMAERFLDKISEG